MSTRDLENKFFRMPMISGYGHWKYTILYKGDFVSHTTTNSLAIDRISEHRSDYISDYAKSGWYTYKQALQALYDEVIRDINSI